MRYHLFRFLRWPGVRYRMIAHRDHRLMYFEDQTLMGEILEVLDRRWYRRLIRWPWFGWEIEADEREISYYFWAPNVHIGEEIRRKILGKHPDMDITRVNEASGEFDDCEFVTATSMKLDRDYPVPIKSFYNEIIDSQAPIVNAVSDLMEGERCLIQFLIEPARNYQKDFDKALRIVKRWDKEDEYEKIELFETNIAGKQTKQLAHCAIRVMAGAKNKVDANRIRSEVTRSFGQFKSEALNSFVAREKWMHVKPLLLKQVRHRLFPLIERRRKRMILNIEELSAVVRLPSGEVNNSRLTRLKLKQLEAPAGVIQMARDAKSKDPTRYLHIGVNSFRLKQTDVYIDLQTLNRHLFALGGSGAGKSVFLENLLLELIRRKVAGYPVGFFLIDPLGGVAQTVITNMPAELRDAVTYVQPDPLAKEHFPFNIFDVDFATTAHSISKNIGDAVGRIWPEGWGPRPSQNFLLGGMALQRIGEASVVNLERLLRNSNYTMQVYQKIVKEQDLVERGVTDFLFKLILGGMPDSSPQDVRTRNDLIDSTLNKLIHFTMSSLLHGSMGARTCGFRWLESMNKGHINILDLSKIQDDHEKRMIGSLAMTMNYQAAISRSSVDDNLLYPLVVDEFPMFIEANEDVINDMADRTRQKNVPIIGAAQGIITQLDKQVADAIGRNFGTQIAFRINHQDDCDWMERKFNLPQLKASDLMATPSNYAYARIGLGRESSMPFSFLSNPPNYKPANNDVVQQAAQHSIKKALAQEVELQKVEQEEQAEQYIDAEGVDLSGADLSESSKEDESVSSDPAGEIEPIDLTKSAVSADDSTAEVILDSVNSDQDLVAEDQEQLPDPIVDSSELAVDSAAADRDRPVAPEEIISSDDVELQAQEEEPVTDEPVSEEIVMAAEDDPESLSLGSSADEEDEYDLTINFDAIGQPAATTEPAGKDKPVASEDTETSNAIEPIELQAQEEPVTVKLVSVESVVAAEDEPASSSSGSGASGEEEYDLTINFDAIGQPAAANEGGNKTQGKGLTNANNWTWDSGPSDGS